MHIDEQGQRFSFAYVRAVASAAGYAVVEQETDDDSVDLTIAQRGGGGTIRSPRLDLQVKHSRIGPRQEETIRYAVPIKNYDELRADNFQSPRLLVLVLVPADTTSWVQQTEEQLAMRHCGYWLSLRGMPQVANTRTVTVHFGHDRMFTVAALRELMAVLAEGGAP